MDIIDAMKARKSVRVYQVNTVSKEHVDIIKGAIAKAVPFDNSSKYRMELVSDPNQAKTMFSGLIGGYGKIVLAPCCLVPKIDDERQSWTNIGFLQEQIVIEATRLGLGTCWVGGLVNKANADAVVGTRANELVTNIIAIGHPKEHFLNNAKFARKRKPKTEIAFCKEWGNNCAEFLDSNPKLDLAVQMAILSPSSINKQPVRLILSEKEAHFYVAGIDGAHGKMNMLETGIFMSHFFMSLRHSGIHPTTFLSPHPPKADEKFGYVGSVRL